MTRKLTVTVSEDTCARLHQVVGRQHISRFLEDLARSRLIEGDLEAAYREMAAGRKREAEAAEWTEALAGDAAGEPHQ